MIYHNAEIARSMNWSSGDANEGEVARAFLEGEKQLLQLSRTQSVAAEALKNFLEATVESPLAVHRATTGEVLVRAGAGRHTLLVTGRTARVLAAYLDEAPVRMQDRFDMTVRRLVDAR
jgi:hypothetical protein